MLSSFMVVLRGAKLSARLRHNPVKEIHMELALLSIFYQNAPQLPHTPPLLQYPVSNLLQFHG
jgi:hypothetical protein